MQTAFTSFIDSQLLIAMHPRTGRFGPCSVRLRIVLVMNTPRRRISKEMMIMMKDRSVVRRRSQKKMSQLMLKAPRQMRRRDRALLLKKRVIRMTPPCPRLQRNPPAQQRSPKSRPPRPCQHHQHCPVQQSSTTPSAPVPQPGRQGIRQNVMRSEASFRPLGSSRMNSGWGSLS